MNDEQYRPRFGRTFDEYKQTDTWGDALLDWPKASVSVPRVTSFTPCSLSPFCSRPNFHLGACDDVERIELITVWDPSTGELYLDPNEQAPQERPFFLQRKRTGT